MGTCCAAGPPARGLGARPEAQAVASALSSCNLDLDWQTWPLATHTPWLTWNTLCYQRVSSALLRLEPPFTKIGFNTAPGPRDYSVPSQDLAPVEDGLLRLGCMGCHHAGCAAHCCVFLWLLLLPPREETGLECAGVARCSCPNVGGAGEKGLKTYRCGRCLTAKYCSQACSRQAWPQHKLACKPA